MSLVKLITEPAGYILSGLMDPPHRRMRVGGVVRGVVAQRRAARCGGRWVDNSSL